MGESDVWPVGWIGKKKVMEVTKLWQTTPLVGAPLLDPLTKLLFQFVAPYDVVIHFKFG